MPSKNPILEEELTPLDTEVSKSAHKQNDISSISVPMPNVLENAPAGQEACQNRKFKENWLQRIAEWEPSDTWYWIIVYITVPIVLWSSIFFIIGDYIWPGGPIFPIIFLLFSGIALGMALELIKIPPLLAMLVMGMIVRNVPYIDFAKDVPSVASASIRQLALVVILIRAGLGLDPVALIKLKGVVIRLAFCPCLAEAATIAVTTHFILHFPWSWGFLLGFVLAAVSPAVVVPCLLSLGERGYGIKKGIPTIVIAAASVDDILAISLFGVTLGTVFSQEDILKTLGKGPMELVMGISFGILWGGFIGIFISKPKKFHKVAVLQRAFYCLLGGCISVFGFQYCNFPGAGALGCLTAAFVAAVIWRKKNILKDDDSLSYIFSLLWYIFQPLLFGLIGCEIDLKSLDSTTVGLGLTCLFIALVVRMLISFLCVSFADLNVKEKFFVAVAWVPKATVQAAIGSIALDTARNGNFGNTEKALGLQVLTMAVLAILITAPIGAIGVMILGPRLLEKQINDESGSNKEECQLEIIDKGSQ